MRGLGLGRAIVALVAAVSTSGVHAQAAADATQGKRLFLRCASCHAVAPGAARIGPNLQSVYGRKVASLPDYNYSAALKAQHFTWDEAKLDAWLTRPNALVPGTTMAFAGLPDANDRKAIIAYLRSLPK